MGRGCTEDGYLSGGHEGMVDSRRHGQGEVLGRPGLINGGTRRRTDRRRRAFWSNNHVFLASKKCEASCFLVISQAMPLTVCEINSARLEPWL